MTQLTATDHSQDQRRPLVVDLDGTLLRSDCLWESAFQFLRQHPLEMWRLPLWLREGKARLKAGIAQRVDLDVESLPYNESLLSDLRTQRAAGRQLILATATHEKYAAAIADHLDLFDEVMASDATVNLSGTNKRDALIARFGERGYDYVGDSRADLPVWSAASHGILIEPDDSVAAAARDATEVIDVTPRAPKTQTARRLLTAMRPHQWLKNLLLFVPLIMAHQLSNAPSLVQAVVAFVAFSLCASSVYLLNDLLDLPDDRRHHSKRLRPFAAGDIDPVVGVFAVPGLLLGAFMLALFLPWEFVAMLAIYYTSTLAYSLHIKRLALFDVLLLAGLYTIRIISGAAAVNVAPSFWLLAFSMFFFLSLAIVKRVVELRTLKRNDESETSGRGYAISDLDMMSQFGTASGFVAVLVLALYVNSGDVLMLYERPQFIWLLCPIVLYLVMRIWLLARRDELHEDPVVFVMRDRQSLCLVALGAALLWLAI